jgi:AcrR family transcriptional regulator
MDNATRSERSRAALLDAAIAIIARDGPGRLTLDAIARESGISKGGLMHQFRSKEAVLKALLQRQIEHFAEFTRAYVAGPGAAAPQPVLAAQIATLREAVATPRSLFFAVLGAAAEEPGLLSVTRETDVRTVEAIRAEASDPELATLRWFAAWGLALTALLGLSPLNDGQRELLFERLLDHRQWPAPGAANSGPP